MARPPFTRPGHRAGFRPAGCRLRASLSLRASCRLLQTRRCTGKEPRARRILVLRVSGDDPSRAFAFARPLAGTRRRDEPLPRGPPGKLTPARTGAIRVKVSFPFSGARVPSSNRAAHPVVVRTPAWKGGPLLASGVRTGWLEARERAARHRRGLRSRKRPAKGECVRRRPRCVPPSGDASDARGSLLTSARAGLPATRHLLPEGGRCIAAMGAPTPFQSPVVPSMTSQALGAARSNGRRAGCSPPCRTARSQRLRRLL